MSVRIICRNLRSGILFKENWSLQTSFPMMMVTRRLRTTRLSSRSKMLTKTKDQGTIWTKQPLLFLRVLIATVLHTWFRRIHSGIEVQEALKQCKRPSNADALKPIKMKEEIKNSIYNHIRYPEVKKTARHAYYSMFWQFFSSPLTAEIEDLPFGFVNVVLTSSVRVNRDL